MRREEKRQKFHEAVLNTLYPPPPSPPQAENEEEKPVNTSAEDFQVELINPDDYMRSSNSSGDDDDDDDDGEDRKCEPQKLTRAQRKRLRKKKLKEDASRRSKIVGPLLPPPNNDDVVCGGGENVSPGVRQNADEKCTVTSDKPREIIGCSDQKKLKNRRKAKKLARDQLKCLSSKENSSEDSKMKSSNETCDQPLLHSSSQD